MLGLWLPVGLAWALLSPPLVPSRCGGVNMAARSMTGQFKQLRRELKGTISPQQMAMLTFVEDYAGAKVQSAEEKLQSALARVQLLEENVQLLGQLSDKDGEIAVYQKDERHSILLALARYRCVLENRCLLERNAEVLYKTIYNKTSDQVQQLIKDQCISKKDGKLTVVAEKMRQRLLKAGYISAGYQKSIVDQMRNRYAYKLISSPIHNPQLIGRVAGWAVGGDGDGALVAVICTIISLDLAYDQLGALAPSEILVLNERHEHIMTWTHGAGLQPLPRPEAPDSKLLPGPSLRPDQGELLQMSNSALQGLCRDKRLRTTGLKINLVNRLLAQEE